MERVKRVANYLLFQTAWLVCILGTNSMALYITCTALFIHFLAVGDWKKEKEIIVTTLLLGGAIDSSLGNLDILQFSNDSRILPGWLACIWVLLGTTLRHSLDWTRRHKLAGALLGFVVGPVSYYAASQLTDISLAEPLWQTLLILAIIWALVVPTLQIFADVWIKRAEIQEIK